MSNCNPSSLAESPFREHLHTNYVPTDAEIEQIRAHLVPHEAELARLESLIQELTEQRDSVTRYIEPHKALISHPRRLPQDVVEQIFLACLPTQHNAVISHAEAPLLLGRICSAWRFIAFAMPRLWASIHISGDFVTSTEERTAALGHWLKRAAQLPLSISVTYNEDGNHYYDGVTEHLVPFSMYWKTLHISNMQADDFLQLAEVNAPLLADIHITLQSNFMRQDAVQVLASNLFKGTNSRKVSITAPAVANFVPATPFVWDHLTHLTLLRYNSPFWSPPVLHFGSAHRLLKGCTHLISLNFCLDSSEGSSGPLTELLLTPYLESLTIIDYASEPDDFHALGCLLDWLVMPRLDQFHLTNIESGIAVPNSDTVFIERFFQRSSLISDLHLNLSNFTSASLLHVLHLLPGLKKLRLGPWYSTYHAQELERNATKLLAALTPGVLTESPCTALQELITESEELGEDIWANFLHAHLDYGTNLRRFELRFEYGPPEIIPDVKPFLDRGLEVCLCYHAVYEVQYTPWEGIEQ
ncbi:hypothetical protein DFH06DRAFT_1045299 [Mycena polygramma]|nr:hypothetical protein DFH06DRAFT_1045299 [Mycena polygramma]